MSLIFNGTETNTVKYNGVEVSTVIYNGIEVFADVPKTIEITNASKYNTYFSGLQLGVNQEDWPESKRGVTWSCSDNASITSEGYLTSTASEGDSISVTATSTYKESISSTVSIPVVYIKPTFTIITDLGQDVYWRRNGSTSEGYAWYETETNGWYFTDPIMIQLSEGWDSFNICCGGDLTDYEDPIDPGVYGSAYIGATIDGSYESVTGELYFDQDTPTTSGTITISNIDSSQEHSITVDAVAYMASERAISNLSAYLYFPYTQD